MKRWGKTLLGLLLCAVMAFGLLPGAASTAKADGKTITGLGTGTIGSPTGNGEWDYVYYGKYNNNPVKYRVLSAETTDFGGTTMLLDCDSTLFEAAFDTNNSNIWENSSIKSGLNGDLFLTKEGVFTPAERDAIASSIKAEKNNDHDGSGWDKLNYTPLTDQKIFLLDASEATSSTYGYTDWGIEHNFDWAASTRAKTGADVWWLLRSPYYSSDADKVSMVKGGGNISYLTVSSSDVGVSPALNINLASVIFSSEISSTDKTYKLTIRDNDIGITLGTVTRNGSAVTVPYTISGLNQGNVTQVSVVMTNATWSNDAGWTAPSGEIPEKYYYGRLDVNKGFTLPTDYDPDWNAYVVAEVVSAEEATDYASAPVAVAIPHVHQFTYTASDAAVTAKCAVGCPDGYDTDGITLTLKAPTNLKYDGNAKEATIDGYPATAPKELAAEPTTVSYYKSTGEGSTTVDGDALSGAPSDCGHYVAQMTWGGATAGLPFSIINDAVSFTVTFKVVNGEWNNGGSDEITVTLNGHEGDTLKLADGDVPSVGAKPKEDYKAGSWSPSEPKTGDVISGDTTYTYTYAAEDISYSVADARGAEHTVGDEKDAVFTVKRNVNDEKTFAGYTGSTMDGVALPEGSHTAEQGSLVLTLKSAYLDTLSVGDHKLKINFTDGSVETTVKIIAAAPTPTPTPSPTSKPVPKTGDSANFPLWLGLILLGLAGLALVAGTGKAARKK